MFAPHVSWPVQRERLSAAVNDVYWAASTDHSPREQVVFAFYTRKVGQLGSRVLGHFVNK